MIAAELKQLFTDLAPQKTEYAPTGIPQLDITWGGGLPSGNIIELHGDAGLGKSTLAVQAGLYRAAAGDKVAYLDVDQALEPMLVKGVAKSCVGLTASPDGFPNFLHLCPSNFNEVDRALDGLLNTGYRLIIIDTICMITRDPASLGSSDRTKVGSRLSREDPAASSRLEAEFLRLYRPRIARAGATLLLVNQMRVDISNWKRRLKPTGGKAMDHCIDVRTRIFPQKKPTTSCRGFNQIMVTSLKNRTGCPRKELPMNLHFGSGVKRAEALGQMLLHYDAVLNKRGRYMVSGLSKALIGEAGFYDWIERNDDRAVQILGAKVGYDLTGASR